jgi:phage baseplate assembly protein gpV
MLGTDTIYPGAGQVINANDKFMVYEDGHVEATDIRLTGDAEFEGTIVATGGQIGGLTIDEWSEMGF